jgi:hypothetical protein
MNKKPNLRIHEVEKGTEIQIKGIEFSEIIAENSPNLGKDMDIQVWEAFRALNRHKHERTSPCHIIVKC